MEIRDDFLLETVSDILDRVDLPAPMGAITTITGDGSEEYALPADFLRLHRAKAAVYEPSYRRVLIPITDEGTWRHLQAVGSTGADRYFKIGGYEGNWTISFYAHPGLNNTVTVAHNANPSRMANAGTPGSAFTNPADVILFPRRLVEAGIVYRWRDRKGLPYQDKYLEYEAQLARLSNDTKVRRIISLNGHGLSSRGISRFRNYIPES
ncbi:MAG: hypothetical protein IPJ55_17310 [Chloracidobacterium sp.]|nr:hypothetical protein [Chloracidobacterium sp.]